MTVDWNDIPDPVWIHRWKREKHYKEMIAKKRRHDLIQNIILCLTSLVFTALGVLLYIWD